MHNTRACTLSRAWNLKTDPVRFLGHGVLVELVPKRTCVLMQGVSMGEAVHQLEQQLIDGHWVLSFESARLAESVMQHITKQAEMCKELLREVMQPLL